MSNPVYLLVVDSLSSAVSERAADTMLRAALRDARLSPDTVTAQDIQRVLSGPLLTRLASVLPPAQASRELRVLARRVAMEHPKAPTLFMDPDGPLNWEQVPTPATVSVGSEDLGSDDFEFDDPDYSAFQGNERLYDLKSPAGQQDLLSDLARQPGVVGVVLCDKSGQVLRALAPKNAAQLGSIVAATVLLFRQRTLNILSADLGSTKVCMRPLGSHCVAVLAGEGVNIGRLMTELKQIQETA
ncbi:roadblock/LC7 domain-containing protein [Deinococcus sonorensis]|uniref:Roadblock/LC7 domain-containing protein n=2 Tax=Deinococcus sonorensis TaxID=309891 RepID=A0AAU7UER7_9DEIO